MGQHVWYSRFDLSRPVEGFKETGTTTLSAEEDRRNCLHWFSFQCVARLFVRDVEERVDGKLKIPGPVVLEPTCLRTF